MIVALLAVVVKARVELDELEQRKYEKRYRRILTNGKKECPFLILMKKYITTLNSYQYFVLTQYYFRHINKKTTTEKQGTGQDNNALSCILFHFFFLLLFKIFVFLQPYFSV